MVGLGLGAEFHSAGFLPTDSVEDKLTFATFGKKTQLNYHMRQVLSRMRCIESPSRSCWGFWELPLS